MIKRDNFLKVLCSTFEYRYVSINNSCLVDDTQNSLDRKRTAWRPPSYTFLVTETNNNNDLLRRCDFPFRIFCHWNLHNPGNIFFKNCFSWCVCSVGRDSSCTCLLFNFLLWVKVLTKCPSRIQSILEKQKVGLREIIKI